MRPVTTPHRAIATDLTQCNLPVAFCAPGAPTDRFAGQFGKRIPMPTTKSKAAQTNHPAKPEHFKYLFIVDDHVIAKTNDLNEAIRLARKHPEAEICEKSFRCDLKSLVSWRNYEKKTAKQIGNPAGDAIENISNLVLECVNDMIEGTIPGGGIDDHCWGDGLLRFYNWNKRQVRRATTIECCKWTGTFHADLCFDVRKTIPDQVAAWLTKLSKLALKAADEVLRVEDDRDMQLLNKVIADDGYLDRLWKQKKRITYGGDVETIDDDEYEHLAKRRGEKVGAA